MTADVLTSLEKKKGRIVFAWNYVPWGGSQIYLLGVMKQAKDEWDLQVVLPKHSNPEIMRYLDQLGVEYRKIDHHLDIEPARTLRRKFARQLARLRAEYDVFRALLSFDVRDTIFQTDIAPWQSVAFLSAMAMRGARVFITLHNVPEGRRFRHWIWKGRFLYVSYLPGLTFLTSNNNTKDRLRGWVNEKFWNRIRVALTGINPPEIEAAATAEFDKSETLSRLGIPADDFLVLCVGNFVDRKGRWIFLDAARRVVGARNDISFVWLTPQLPTEADRERIASYGLGEKFRLVHSKEIGPDRMDVLKFFRIADVFTLPSFIEGLPTALLEAMALGIPSISTNVFAIPEALKHLETGILVEAGDPVGLAHAILQLKDDPALREGLAKRGREFVLERLDERDASRSVVEAYVEALNDGR